MKKRRLLIINIFIILIYPIIFLSFLISCSIQQESFPNLQRDKEKIENKILKFSSKKQNILFIMPDSVSGLDINSILETPEFNNNISSKLLGFTSYANLLTSHWSTNGALPGLYGGHTYNASEKKINPDLQDINFFEYMKRSVDSSLKAFNNANWNTSWIHPMYYKHEDPYSYIGSDVEQFEKDFAKYETKSIKNIDFVEWYKTSHPNDFKATKLPQTINNKKNNKFTQDNHVMDIAILDGLKKIEAYDEDKDDKPNFLNVYLAAPHHYPAMDREGNYKNYNYDHINEDDVYITKIGFMKKIVDIVENLQKKKMYDNTMIIIASDHGYEGLSLPLNNHNLNYGYKNGSLLKGIREIYKKDKKIARLFPTLMVKPFKARDNLQINYDDLYSNSDLLNFIAHYLRLEKEKTNNPIFDVQFDSFKNLRENIAKIHLLDDIKGKTFKDRSIYFYGSDGLWKDHFKEYQPPTTKNRKFASDSYSIKNSIFDLNNYLVANKDDGYYPIDQPEYWDLPWKSSNFKFKDVWSQIIK